jgi:hypothetical protein
MNDENTKNGAGETVPTDSIHTKGMTNSLSGKLPPELLQWAQQLYTDEEIIAGLEEVRRTGGLKFSDFLPELEQAAHD